MGELRGPVTPLSTIPPVTLLERDDELAALPRPAGTGRAPGRGGLVVVSGEPGAGKTVARAGVRRRPRGRRAGPVGRVRPAVDAAAARPAPRRRPTSSATPSPTLLRDADQPHEIFAAVFEHLRADARRSSSSTTCTGPTRARSTCCASCCAASASTRSLVVGTRPRRRDRRRPPAAVAARRRRPLARRRRSSRCRR